MKPIYIYCYDWYALLKVCFIFTLFKLTTQARGNICIMFHTSMQDTFLSCFTTSIYLKDHHCWSCTVNLLFQINFSFWAHVPDGTQVFLGNSVFEAVFLWLQNVKGSFGLPVKSNSFDRIIFSLLVTLLCCSDSPYYAIIQIRSSPGTLQFSLFCIWISPLSSAFPGCSQPIFVLFWFPPFSCPRCFLLMCVLHFRLRVGSSK